MNSNEIKKELDKILDNYIANNLPVDKRALRVDLRLLISDIIDDLK